MPEYLAPGVYVEEVDTGSKPIEGVSTSTAGMVGVTERGPVNVPMLVTSFAEFRRIFGGYLNYHRNPNVWYLPNAVEGFFQNGGKRLFVTRVVADLAPNQATHASVILMDRGERTGVADMNLVAHARVGDTLILVESTVGLNDGDRLRIDDGTLAEYVTLTTPNAVLVANTRFIALRIPLYRNQASGTTVEEVAMAATPVPNDLNTTLAANVSAGTTVLPLADRTNVDPDDVLQLGVGDEREFAVVASVPSDTSDLRVTLRHPIGSSHTLGTAVVLVSEGAIATTQTLSQVANAGDGLLVVSDATPFTVGNAVRIGAAADTTREYHLLAELYAMRMRHGAYDDHPALEPVIQVTMPDTPAPNAHSTQLQTAANAGTSTLLLQDRGNLAVNDRLRIGAGPLAEYGVVASVATAVTDHRISLLQPLARNHASGDAVVLVTRTPGANTTTLVQPITDGEEIVFLADDGTDFPAGTIVEIGELSTVAGQVDQVEYQVLDPSNMGALVLSAVLTGNHERGALVGRRDPLLEVEALDPGDWGNELRVIAEDDTPLLETTVFTNTGAGLPVPLASTVGIEVGSVLEFGYDPAVSGVSGTLAKVTRVMGNSVELGATGLATPVPQGMLVRTKEFKLTVQWVKSNQVVESEVLRYLSLDHRHSRYVQTIVGDINGTLRPGDRRPEGQSEYIRVDDQATAAQSETRIRLGPDVLTEVLSSGETRAAGRFLTGGTNPLGGITNNTYIGTDNTDPALRTGLYTLKNEERISIVAIPGRTEQAIQEALINHCETMRYRFAVLDSVRGTDPTEGASLAAVQSQRSVFDTKYAALYYPWLTVPDPFPTNPQIRTDFSIPPSGHMIGIYARTDIERGVHKAPANTVIRGITRLQRSLTKAEHDLLNPSPVNINVLRDFREQGRGLRVWGARCITSDPDWKYINVRRLFIFLEASLEEGTQWVVFEPNDEPLWARVRQSVTNFLIRVWRDGALMGSTPEEAFFVKCDRTTMTQDDIDNGRMIMLIGVAPVKPAEFVIIRIGQWVGGSEVEEL